MSILKQETIFALLGQLRRDVRELKRDLKLSSRESDLAGGEEPGDAAGWVPGVGTEYLTPIVKVTSLIDDTKFLGVRQRPNDSGWEDDPDFTSKGLEVCIPDNSSLPAVDDVIGVRFTGTYLNTSTGTGSIPLPKYGFFSSVQVGPGGGAIQSFPSPRDTSSITTTRASYVIPYSNGLAVTYFPPSQGGTPLFASLELATTTLEYAAGKFEPAQRIVDNDDYNEGTGNESTNLQCSIQLPTNFTGWGASGIRFRTEYSITGADDDNNTLELSISARNVDNAFTQGITQVFTPVAGSIDTGVVWVQITGTELNSITWTAGDPIRFFVEMAVPQTTDTFSGWFGRFDINWTVTE